MSGIDVIRSFAESRENDAITINGAITYRDCRNVMADVERLRAQVAEGREILTFIRNNRTGLWLDLIDAYLAKTATK